MKITIKAGLFRDKPLLMDLFDTAVDIYRQHAKDANLDDRLKEQFVRQAEHGAELTMQLWHQRDPHVITFQLDRDESDRWLLLNMLETGADIFNHAEADVVNLAAKAHFRRRLQRIEQLREMIEDAAGRL
jgi:hypothetical protein